MKTYAMGLVLALGLGVGAGSLLAQPAHAEGAKADTSKDVARELTQLVMPKDGYQKMMEQMAAGMAEGMSRSGAPVPKDFSSKMMTVVQEALPYEEQLTFMTKLYSARFSDGELKDMVTFYKTPTGSKLVKELPNIMRESAVWASQLLPKRLPPLMQKHGLIPEQKGGAPAKAAPQQAAPQQAAPQK